MFNLLEIVGNNNIQVRNRVSYKFDDGSEALSHYHRYVVNSTNDLSKEPELIKLIAEAFPFIEETSHSDGIHKDIAFIRIMANNQSYFRYDALVYAVENGMIVASERKHPQIVILTLTEKEQTQNQKIVDQIEELELDAEELKVVPDVKAMADLTEKLAVVSDLSILPEKVQKVANLLSALNS